MPPASPSMPSDVPSNTQVDKAGKALREWWDDPMGPVAQLREPISVVVAFRASFQYPLVKVADGVRKFVQRESSTVVVAQRLKRMPQMVYKLARFRKLRLSQMQDVGGCRAVLAGGAPEVAGVLRKIERDWDVVAVDDYTRFPKDTGYRAVHVVVRRDGRLIEVQLRTQPQHHWAEVVEAASAKTGFQLKDGVGPGDLVAYFRDVADVVALLESGDAPPEEAERRLSAAYESVRHYFEERS